MENALTGAVVYDPHHYFDTNDGKTSHAVFMEEAPEYGRATGMLECFLSSELVFGNDRKGMVIQHSGGRWEEHGSKPDFCIYRGTDWRIAFFIEQCGIPCFPSSETIRLASDKAVDHSWMVSHGVPTPSTAYTDSAMLPLKDEDFPLILKSCNGHSGSSVFRVSNILSYENYLSSIRPDFHIRQEIMPTGNDLRITLLGRQIDRSIIRRPTGPDFRSQAVYGGQRESFIPSETNSAIIQKAIAALPARSGFMACDFLFDEDDHLVFGELNSCPGFVVYNMNGGDLIQRYIDYIVNELNNM